MEVGWERFSQWLERLESYGSTAAEKWIRAGLDCLSLDDQRGDNSILFSRNVRRYMRQHEAHLRVRPDRVPDSATSLTPDDANGKDRASISDHEDISQIAQSVQQMIDGGVGDLAVTAFFEAVRRAARESVAGPFWSAFQSGARNRLDGDLSTKRDHAAESAIMHAASFTVAACLLATTCFGKARSSEERRVRSQLRQRIAAELSSGAEYRTEEALVAVVLRSLAFSFDRHHRRCMEGEEGEEEKDMDIEQTGDISSPTGSSHNQQSLPAAWICEALETLGRGQMAHEACGLVLKVRIQALVRRTCKAQYEESMLSQLLEWVEEVCLPWIHTTLREDEKRRPQQIKRGGVGGTREEQKGDEDDRKGKVIKQMRGTEEEKNGIKERNGSSENQGEKWKRKEDGKYGQGKAEEDRDKTAGKGVGDPTWKQRWRRVLFEHVHSSLLSLRMEEIFDVITDFPDSRPALKDIRKCFQAIQSGPRNDRQFVATTNGHRLGLSEAERRRRFQWMRQRVIQSLRQALKQRLLHAGAETAQVLEIFSSLIRALKLLDPSGVILEQVGMLVKDYLRQRRDTVRCIVSGLTGSAQDEEEDDAGGVGDGEGDGTGVEGKERRGSSNGGQRGSLLNIWGINDGGLGEGSGADGLIEQHEDSDEEEEAAVAAALTSDAAAKAHQRRMETWEPEPVDADPHQSSHSRLRSDILSTLVGIYGSTDLFVEEYRMMLADKLLRNTRFDTDRHVTNLEMLKLRFGDDALHTCEIMVKDINDSRRINANIRRNGKKDEASAEGGGGSNGHGQKEGGGTVVSMDVEGKEETEEREEKSGRDDEHTPSSPSLTSRHDEVQASIISHHYWPSFQSNPINLHPSTLAALDAFSKNFGVLKAPRQLQWHHSLGTVEVEVTTGGPDGKDEVTYEQADE